MNRTRKEKTQGGGIAIGIHQSLIYRDVSHEIPDDIQNNFEILMVQVFPYEKELLIINIYIANYQEQKRHIQKLREWMNKIILYKPLMLKIISGDFNNKKDIFNE